MKAILSILVATGLLMTACKKRNQGPAADSNEWKYFVAHDDFIIELPANWKFVRLDGIDSYVGLFTNERDSIEFDYGWYSGEFHGDSAKTLLSHEVIDHRDAVLATGASAPFPKALYIDSVNGSGFTQNALSMYQVSSKEINQEKIIRIFKSVKFN